MCLGSPAALESKPHSRHLKWCPFLSTLCLVTQVQQALGVSCFLLGQDLPAFVLGTKSPGLFQVQDFFLLGWSDRALEQLPNPGSSCKCWAWAEAWILPDRLQSRSPRGGLRGPEWGQVGVPCSAPRWPAVTNRVACPQLTDLLSYHPEVRCTNTGFAGVKSRWPKDPVSLETVLFLASPASLLHPGASHTASASTSVQTPPPSHKSTRWTLGPGPLRSSHLRTPNFTASTNSPLPHG